MNGKNAGIVALVASLRLATRGWCIVDHWEADECAVGIARIGTPERLVYISNFKTEDGHYDFECEDARGHEDPVNGSSRGANVSESALIRLLENYLG